MILCSFDFSFLPVFILNLTFCCQIRRWKIWLCLFSCWRKLTISAYHSAICCASSRYWFHFQIVLYLTVFYHNIVSVGCLFPLVFARTIKSEFRYLDLNFRDFENLIILGLPTPIFNYLFSTTWSNHFLSFSDNRLFSFYFICQNLYWNFHFQLEQNKVHYIRLDFVYQKYWSQRNCYFPNSIDSYLYIFIAFCTILRLLMIQNQFLTPPMNYFMSYYSLCATCKSSFYFLYFFWSFLWQYLDQILDFLLLFDFGDKLSPESGWRHHQQAQNRLFPFVELDYCTLQFLKSLISARISRFLSCTDSRSFSMIIMNFASLCRPRFFRCSDSVGFSAAMTCSLWLYFRSITVLYFSICFLDFQLFDYFVPRPLLAVLLLLLFQLLLPLVWSGSSAAASSPLLNFGSIVVCLCAVFELSHFSFHFVYVKGLFYGCFSFILCGRTLLARFHRLVFLKGFRFANSLCYNGFPRLSSIVRESPFQFRRSSSQLATIILSDYPGRTGSFLPSFEYSSQSNSVSIRTQYHYLNYSVYVIFDQNQFLFFVSENFCLFCFYSFEFATRPEHGIVPSAHLGHCLDPDRPRTQHSATITIFANFSHLSNLFRAQNSWRFAISGWWFFVCCWLLSKQTTSISRLCQYVAVHGLSSCGFHLTISYNSNC